MALNSRYMHGLSFGVAFRISTKWRLNITYSRFWSRSGNQQLEWLDYPGQPDVGHHLYFLAETQFIQHDLLTLVEFRPGWKGLYFVGGQEFSFGRRTWNGSWVTFYNGESRPEERFTDSDTGGFGVRVYGLGYEQRLGGDTFLDAVISYSFNQWTSGPKLLVTTRYEL